MIKKYFIYTASILMIAVGSSCVNNSDEKKEITPTPPTPEVTLTAKDMEGTWEIYYLSKSVGQGGVYGQELRSPEFDGYTITFDGQDAYRETDPEGGILISGNYYIIGNAKDSIHFKFNYQGRDSSTYMMVTRKTTDKKFFTRVYAYPSTLNGQDVLVKDVQLLRNVVNAPNQFDGTSGTGRLLLKATSFYGNWKVTAYQQAETNQSGQMELVTKGKDIIGTEYTFNSDGTFKMVDTSKKETIEGNFIVSGDVLHLFYYKTVNGKEVRTSIDYWIKTQSENSFEIYSKVSTYENKFYQIKQTSTIVAKVSSN